MTLGNTSIALAAVISALAAASMFDRASADDRGTSVLEGTTVKLKSEGIELYSRSRRSIAELTQRAPSATSRPSNRDMRGGRMNGGMRRR
jgi:hypothetical protein